VGREPGGAGGDRGALAGTGTEARVILGGPKSAGKSVGRKKSWGEKCSNFVGHSAEE